MISFPSVMDNPYQCNWTKKQIFMHISFSWFSIIGSDKDVTWILCYSNAKILHCSLANGYICYCRLLEERITSLSDLEKATPLLTRSGEIKTETYDVSTWIGDGSSEYVGVFSSSPLVTAMMLSIILNLVNFSILYYQVNKENLE